MLIAILCMIFFSEQGMKWLSVIILNNKNRVLSKILVTINLNISCLHTRSIKMNYHSLHENFGVSMIIYKFGLILYTSVMKRILISACLAGDRVRYDGKTKPVTDPMIKQLSLKGLLVKVCPEVLSGLKTPRPPAQIVNGSGLDVLNGTAAVMDINGHDVTVSFVRGAEYALSLVKKYGIEVAVLKEKSPSCGVHYIYDGQFTARLIPGSGVTTALLKQYGIPVFSENELDQLTIQDP